MSDKIYLGSAKAIKTEHGGLLKVSFNRDDLQKMMDNLNAKGWINLNCSKRKEVSQYGQTHSISIDNWQPDTTQAREGLNQPQTTPTMNDYDDDLAF
jgi:hypothetical protein